MPIQFGGQGVVPSLGNLITTTLDLTSGEAWLIPSGRWSIKPGKFTVFQILDSITGYWRTIGGGTTVAPMETVFSDGANYRLANQTGCAVGALLTNAGTGYTSAPTVTPSAGSSMWRAILGGAVSTSVTVNNGGSGYTYAPSVQVSPPPPGGLPATMTCAISAGAVSSVTVNNQGAGYASPPVLTFVNDPREGLNGVSVGGGASASAVLTGAGTVTGVVCIDHGTALTSLPTLAFSGGGGASAAATVIMNWTITAYNINSGGANYAATTIVGGIGGFPATSPAYTNPLYQSGLLKGRAASITAAFSAGAIINTGQVVNDGGVYPGAPTAYIISSTLGGVITQATFNAFSMGGAGVDTSLVFPT